jgi:hypothetical protein
MSGGGTVINTFAGMLVFASITVGVTRDIAWQCVIYPKI